MSNKGMRFWWFIEKEEQKEMCCCSSGLSQFETGVFRVCRKKIAKLEARKAEPDGLQLAQAAEAWSVPVRISLALLLPGRI